MRIFSSSVFLPKKIGLFFFFSTTLLQAMVSAEGVKWCLIYMPSLTQDRGKKRYFSEFGACLLASVYSYEHLQFQMRNFLKDICLLFLLFWEQLQWLLSFLLLLGSQVSPLNFLCGAACV